MKGREKAIILSVVFFQNKIQYQLESTINP